MEKIRIFKRPDGSIIKSHPSAIFQARENFDGCKFPDYTNGLPYMDVEADALDLSDGYIEQFYIDGEVKKGSIKKDLKWDRCIMPEVLVKSKHRAKHEKIIEDELKKKSPDAILVSRSMRELDSIRHWTPLRMHEKALENLDDRVDSGESDKPEIRKKLKEKISQFKKEAQK